MLVGVIDRIEIWDLDRWKRKDAQMDDQAPHNTESVAALERSLP
jgi:DNA-binding transcriptional regulator/RsmH inhibitor MraZ